jgi:hypothetical protein
MTWNGKQWVSKAPPDALKAKQKEQASATDPFCRTTVPDEPVFRRKRQCLLRPEPARLDVEIDTMDRP